MGNAKASDACWEAESYLKKAEDVISRSFHELASFQLYDCEPTDSRLISSVLEPLTVNPKSSLQRRKSATELNFFDLNRNRRNYDRNLQDPRCSNAARSLFAVNQIDENPTARRKRFTRRQRREVSSRDPAKRSCQSTSGLNRYSLTSSSDDESSSRNSDCISRRLPKKSDRSQKEKGVSEPRNDSVKRFSSPESIGTAYLKTNRNCQLAKSKGPAARKAQRRAALKTGSPSQPRLNQARSHARLDSIEDDVLKPSVSVRRSTSVKDINGTMVDFLNQESVVRWTSQVLAELDSLPSSQLNLNAPNENLAEEPTTSNTSVDKRAQHRRLLKTSSSSSRISQDGKPPPVPPHRISRNVTNNFLPPSEVMLSSISSCSSTISDSTYSDFSSISNSSKLDSGDAFKPLSILINSFDSNTENETPHVLTPQPTEESWLDANDEFRQESYRNRVPLVDNRDYANLSRHSLVTPKFECDSPQKKENEVTPCSHHSVVECTSTFHLFAKTSARTSQHASAVVVPHSKKVPKKGSNAEPECEKKTGSVFNNVFRKSIHSSAEVAHPKTIPNVVSRSKSNPQDLCESSAKKCDNDELSIMPPLLRLKHLIPKFSSTSAKSRDGRQKNVVLREFSRLDNTKTERSEIRQQMDPSIRLTQSVYEESPSRTKHSEVSKAQNFHSGHPPLARVLSEATCRIGFADAVPLQKLRKDSKLSASETLSNSTSALDVPMRQKDSASPLSVWKKKVEERALEAAGSRLSGSGCAVSRESSSRSQNTENRQSVHGVVASLIRAAEETRFKALDRPSLLQSKKSNLSRNGCLQQEVGTQTSPVSLSRSSSFDWINEPLDPVEVGPKPGPFAMSSQYSNLPVKPPVTHLKNPPADPGLFFQSNAKLSLNCYSSRSIQPRNIRFDYAEDNADDDVEVMIKKSEKIRRQVMEERQQRANQDIDESVAMLLGYAEGLTLSPHNTITKNCSNPTSSKQHEGLRTKKEKSEKLSVVPQSSSRPIFVHDTSFSDCTADKKSFNSSSDQNNFSLGSSLMNDSIYDNVQGFRKPSFVNDNDFSLNASSLDDPKPEPTSPTAHRIPFASSLAMPARDISVCSGLLADSEGSPSSPPPNFLPEKKSEKRSSRSASSSAIRRRSKIAPAEVKAAFCMDRSNVPKEAVSPPPPSPQSATKVADLSETVEATERSSKLQQHAGSCEELNTQRDQQEDEVFTMRKQKAEEEAAECCRWLRDAGFPQYAGLYEEHQFPIDIRSVQRDHEFLDADSLRALFRRLNALNRCAIMKVENVVLRKRSEQFESRLLDFEDNEMIASNCDDDEEQFAISQKWKYQRKSHTWSRIVGEEPIAVRNRYAANKKDIANGLSEEIWKNSGDRAPRGVSRAKVSRGYSHEEFGQNDDQGPLAATSSDKAELKKGGKNRSLQRSQSERIKERARALMKRMDIRSSSRRRKQRQGAEQPNEPHEMVIGEPVLVSHYSASPHSMRIYPDNYLNSKALRAGNMVISSGQLSSDDRLTDDAIPPVQPTNQFHSYTSVNTHRSQIDSASMSRENLALRVGRQRSSSRRRMGMVLLTPDSPSEVHFLDRSAPFNGHVPTLAAYPSAIHNYKPSDPLSPRIYDRVADDLFSADQKQNDLKKRLDFGGYERYNVSNEQFSSSKYRYEKRFTKEDQQAISEANLMAAFNRNLIYDNICSTPNSDKPNARDARPGTSQHWSPCSARQACNSTTNSQMFVRSDRIHGHTSGPTSSSPEATVNRHANSKSSIGRSFQGSASPGSSCVGSMSSLPNRLKIDIDLHNKHTTTSISPISVFYANSAERSPSSLESSANDEDARQDSAVGERRDSGVGSSLSRSPSGPTTQRQRASLLISIHSNNNSMSMRDFRKKVPTSLPFSPGSNRVEESETFMSDDDLLHCMDALSADEVLRVRKLAFLKLSALIEKYAGRVVRIGNGSSGNGGIVKNWAVQKFKRKLRSSDVKLAKEVSIFGLSLTTVQSRTGYVLPRCILEIMQFLRTAAPDTIGIFRKNGVRSRIMELRTKCSVPPGEEVFPNGKDLDLSQVHDIADMLKQYFRELPEPLMTAKYSDAFANIFLHVPKNYRFEALQQALLLLPDENREALQTLLFFLHDIAKHSTLNNMTSQNLAVCFAPSLFHLGVSRLNAVSSTSRHKTIGAAGMPTEREMKESQAAQECLVQMIDDCVKLFITPSVGQSFSLDADSSGFEIDNSSLAEILSPNKTKMKTYLEQSSNELLKEHHDRWKGWYLEDTVYGVEISSRKSLDRNSLRYFRVWVDVEAPPKEILTRIVRERNLWDPQTINWRTIESSSGENIDIFQYVINDTPSHPTRDVVVMRLWRTDIKDLRGGCTLVEKSLQTQDSQLLGGIPATVHLSRFLVEPNAGRSRVTYISRVDLKGRSNIWYRKVYGSLLARQMSQLRDSFRQLNRNVEGPETKL